MFEITYLGKKENKKRILKNLKKGGGKEGQYEKGRKTNYFFGWFRLLMGRGSKEVNRKEKQGLGEI